MALDRISEPARWLSAVYSDRVIVTQFDDGNTAWPEVGYRPTSSCSMPSAVLGMLDALDVCEGMRVLEIGTGTGYNAALLAQRLSDEHVTTMEVDPVVAWDHSDPPQDRLRRRTIGGVEGRPGRHRNWPCCTAAGGVHGTAGPTHPGCGLGRSALG